MKKVIPHFKIKGSWGIVGNHRGVTEFGYQSALTPVAGTYWFGDNMGGVQGYTESIIADPYLTWEESKQFNIGAKMALFEKKLTLGGEYFKDNRTNIYTSNGKVSALYGFDTSVSIMQNMGKVDSHGYELYGNWTSSVGDVKYNIGGTLSFAQSEVIDLGMVDQPYPWMSNIGYPLGARTGLVAEGFFNSYDEIASAPTHTFYAVQPGDIRYKDLNGDGLIDANDVARIGYGECPEFFYGISLGISYKGLGISALFQGTQRSDLVLGSIVSTPFINKTNIYEHHLNYWTPENVANATFPRLSTIYNNTNNVRNSTLWIRDASYLRLKNVEVYYDFPQELLKKTFLKGVKVFATGYDLYSWDDIKIIDPEYDGSAAQMPIMRNISFGCSIKF
jgi:hypothetical protein